MPSQANRPGFPLKLCFFIPFLIFESNKRESSLRGDISLLGSKGSKQEIAAEWKQGNWRSLKAQFMQRARSILFESRLVQSSLVQSSLVQSSLV